MAAGMVYIYLYMTLICVHLWYILYQHAFLSRRRRDNNQEAISLSPNTVKYEKQK